MSLSGLDIEHCGDIDYTLFGMTNFIPECVVLDYVLHYCRGGTQKNVAYSVSAILRQWDPNKCKETEVLLCADVLFDFQVEVEEGANTLKSTKSPNDRELK